MPPRSEVDDRQALSIYLALNVLLGPAQAYFFTQLLDVHASIYPALLPRVAQVIVLISAVWTTTTRWYMRYRTETLISHCALLFALTLECNRTFLAL